MKILCIILVLVGSSFAVHLLKVQSELNNEMFNYLHKFGYLPKQITNSKNVTATKEFKSGILLLQRNSNIPVTGHIDKETIDIMRRSRCGVSDSNLNIKRRHKRFTLLSTKWHRNDLTWHFLNKKHPKSAADAKQIRKLLTKAFKEWQKHSQLRVSERNDEFVDIKIVFERLEHGDGSNFDGIGGVLAHAYPPNTDIGGDVHFDEEENWNFKDDGSEGVNFFNIALHEIGHALGLGHSDVREALMYPSYRMINYRRELHEDDIQGIQSFYGVRQRIFPRTTTSRRTTTTQRTTERPTRATAKPTDSYRRSQLPDRRPTIIIPTKPNRCGIQFDAISDIRNEIYIFKDRYMWRINEDSSNSLSSPEPFEIDKMWNGLPKSVTKIDAFYENKKTGQFWMFVGDKIYIFMLMNQKIDLFSISSLSKLQLPSYVHKIDAIFTWGNEERTYIFAGDKYWRMDEQLRMVEKDYPRNIASIWKNVYDIDTGFQKDGKTYFFKGKAFYQFDDAHAFSPGSGLGGDAHFDDEENWNYVDFNMRASGTSFFFVALHEFGHSLGLGHAALNTSIMFPWYWVYNLQKNVLPDDDRIGIEFLYGKKNLPTPVTPLVPTTTVRSSNQIPATTTSVRPTRPIVTTPRPPPSKKPDTCNTGYDAIMTIRSDIFIFKGRYMWRIKNGTVMAGYPSEIQNMWSGFPETFTHINAGFENYKQNEIWFFVGVKIYVYAGSRLVTVRTLTDLGLGVGVKKIDAIFTWGPKNVFGGDNYWRMDEDFLTIAPNYPRNITGVWRNLEDIDMDTGFQRNGRTYFFKGRIFYEFDYTTMTLNLANPRMSAQFWMKCPPNEADAQKISLLSKIATNWKKH
ncbi:unnamed protein product [Diamesa hyperborea]